MYTYYAEVTLSGSGCDMAQSAEAEVVVVADPFITLQPSDTSYCQFAAPVIPLEVAVDGGTGTYSYQWYESSTAGTTAGDPIPGATSSTYVPPVGAVGTLYYYCIITQSGANCEVVSDYAAIVTNEAPEFTMTLVDGKSAWTARWIPTRLRTRTVLGYRVTSGTRTRSTVRWAARCSRARRPLRTSL